MNCPTKDTSNSHIPGYNQNPSPLDNDLVTNALLNSSPSRPNQKTKLPGSDPSIDPSMASDPSSSSTSSNSSATARRAGPRGGRRLDEESEAAASSKPSSSSSSNLPSSATDTTVSYPIPITKSISGETTPLRNSPPEISTFGGVGSIERTPSDLTKAAETWTNPFQDPPAAPSIHHRNSSSIFQSQSNLGSSSASSFQNYGAPQQPSFFSSITNRLRSTFNNNGFAPLSDGNNPPSPRRSTHTSPIAHKIDLIGRVLFKYIKFVGPSIILSVAYMDPGNYVTAVSAGAMYKYNLLFVILVSNIFAVFLQALCIKLGSVTGLDLAQNCREHLPNWLNITIYIMAEIAIIATDLAEVVGTAISLDILFGVPLAVGVCLTIIDVLIILMAYRPNGEMKIVRYFEYLVSALVFLTVICFAIELGNIGPVNPGEIFRGFLPSGDLFETQGLYLSCGILGATVMPHSLYLGSGLVQPRLRDFDKKHGYFDDSTGNEESDEIAVAKYKPSIHAINYGMKYSIAELIISLSTVAIFVNSAILIVAGATLANTPEAVDADLYSIYDMLRSLLSPAAGTVFALALLFSGQSAGIVCTLAGQMVAEGFIAWTVRPWVRRLITRSLAVIPCLALSLFVGRKGLADVLTGSQVVLSLLLPFVSAPLLYFTAKKSIMKVALLPSNISEQPLQRQNSYTAVNRNPPSVPSESSAQANGSLSPAQTLTSMHNEETTHLSIDDNSDSEDSGYDDMIIATTRRISEDHIRARSQSVGSNLRTSLQIPRDIEEQDSDSDEGHDIYDDDMSSIMIPAYKDMSNSTLTNVTAVIILALISGLNFFLIVSAAMGADVHF